jgi:hypothetical protein
VEQSSGNVTGWIDEGGVPRGSLALASGGGVRVLKGSAEYLISNVGYADVDATNLSTTITVPVGYTLVVAAYGVANFVADEGALGIAVDNSVLSSASSQLNSVVPFALQRPLRATGTPT